MNPKNEEEFFEQLYKVSTTGVVHDNGRILYPAMVVIGMGMYGFLPAKKKLVKFNSGSCSYFDVGFEEGLDVYNEIRQDKVEVVLINQWNIKPLIVKRIYSPKGNGWL